MDETQFPPSPNDGLSLFCRCADWSRDGLEGRAKRQGRWGDSVITSCVRGGNGLSRWLLTQAQNSNKICKHHVLLSKSTGLFENTVSSQVEVMVALLCSYNFHRRKFSGQRVTLILRLYPSMKKMT